MKFDTRDLYSLKTSLATVPEKINPLYWNVVFRVIRDISRGNFPAEPSGDYGALKFHNVSDLHMEDMKIRIDGDLEGGLIKHCWVKFAPGASVRNVRFEDCVFVFESEGVPKPELQKVGAVLLAANDLQNVTITAT